ncbi:hypothetical protein GCM10027037_34410 [Mucilaginibacter koreensis]
MSFILSKLLLFLLHPFLWVLALAGFSLFVKNQFLKKRSRIAAVIVLIVFSNPFLLNRVARWWDYPRPQLSPTQKYSCVIVLGGFVSEDAQGKGFFNNASDRFIQGLRLQSAGRAGHILITGGNASLMPDGFTEGGWIVNELKALHVPDSAVIIEQQARNTQENARYSKALLQKAHLPPPYLLVTSAFHMRRALATFGHEHLEVVPYACNFGGGADGVSMDDFIPNAGVMDGWTTYFKELIGWLIIQTKS